MSLIDEQIAALEEKRQAAREREAARQRNREFERAICGFWRGLSCRGVHRLDGTDAITSQQEAVLRDAFDRLQQTKPGWIAQGPEHAYLLPYRWNRKRLPADAAPARIMSLRTGRTTGDIIVTLDDRGRLWGNITTTYAFKYVSATEVAQWAAALVDRERD